MKRLIKLLLTLVLILIPLCANSGIIGNVNMTLDASSPTGYVTIGSTTLNVYLDYDVKLGSETTSREAFCVENANAVSGSTNPYTLLTVDSGLGSFGLTPSKYLLASVVADYFYNHYAASEAMKAGAQLVIWEIMFETDSDFNFSSGSFQALSATNNYVGEASDIWSAVQNLMVPTASNTWVLAVNPTVQVGQTINVAPAQNYLIHYNVPERRIYLTFRFRFVRAGRNGQKAQEIELTDKKIKEGRVSKRFCLLYLNHHTGSFLVAVCGASLRPANP